jgi:uncharacterized membrane protein
MQWRPGQPHHELIYHAMSAAFLSEAVATRRRELSALPNQPRIERDFLEIAGGFLTFGLRPAVLTNIVLSLTQGELADTRTTFSRQRLLGSAQHYSIGTARFAAFYLVSDGNVKLRSVIGVLKSPPWACPSSLAVFGIFVLCQTYLFAGGGPAHVI